MAEILSFDSRKSQLQESEKRFYRNLNDIRIHLGLSPVNYHFDFLEDQVFSRTIFVKIHNEIYRISCEELDKVFSRFGILDNVVVFSHGHGFHSKICFNSKESAIKAFESLNGRNIYDDCCKLDLFLVQDFFDELVKADFGQIVKEHQNCVVSLHESTEQQIEQEPENVPKSTEQIVGTLTNILRDCSHNQPPKHFGDGRHDNLEANSNNLTSWISLQSNIESVSRLGAHSKGKICEKPDFQAFGVILNSVVVVSEIVSVEMGHMFADMTDLVKIEAGYCGTHSKEFLVNLSTHKVFVEMLEKKLDDIDMLEKLRVVVDDFIELPSTLGEVFQSIASFSSFIFDPRKGFVFPLHLESSIDDFIKVLNALGDAFGSVQSRSFVFDPGKCIELSLHTTRLGSLSILVCAANWCWKLSYTAEFFQF